MLKKNYFNAIIIKNYSGLGIINHSGKLKRSGASKDKTPAKTADKGRGGGATTAVTPE